MLQELRISNLALIDSLVLELTASEVGLLVLTGETGAGKSILLSAIHLLNGRRGTADWIRGNCDEAVIEALFRIRPDQHAVLELLKEQGLDDEDSLIVRRVLSRKGRNRVFVNDRLVTSRLAGRLLENLVTIASQHDHQQLLNSSKHLQFLDTYGDLDEMRQAYTRRFHRWQQLLLVRRQLQEKEQDKEQRRDFLAFQLGEIQSAAITAGEDENLDNERRVLRSSAELADLVGQSCAHLSGPTPDTLNEVSRHLDRAAALDPGLAEVSRQFTSATLEIEDCGRTLRAYLEQLPQDRQRIEQINARLAELKALQRKYGPTLAEVIAFAAAAEQELAGLESLEQEMEQLDVELETMGREVMIRATELSAARQEVAGRLASAMQAELASLSFPQAEFVVDIASGSAGEKESLQASGGDQVSFLFSANPGEAPKELVKVASGGELSRLLLAMKCLLARRDLVDTVIFDEVDAGIGGQAAEAVAEKIYELAGHHQVFCITHLPQIAAYAHRHYRVDKEVEDNRTRSTVRVLPPEARVDEIARMLAGTNPTAQTLAYAEELLNRRAGGQ
ncbi:MAG: DNA repair protein RecN [Desulfobulbus propionicus]|nr:MAG: DNA repair protein RecN [Desulfobulbus propionicus]